MIKKIHFLSLAILSSVVMTAGLQAKLTEEQKAERRAAAIAEVKQLLGNLTAETNKLNEALTAAQKGKEVVNALDAWANALDTFKKEAKAMESKKGFKFLKAKEPPEEIKPDLEAFMSSVQTMSETLKAKVELFKDNPKFQKRMEKVLAKLKDL